MQFDNKESFYHSKIMGLTHSTFLNCFQSSIVFIKNDYSEDAMGYYSIEYIYLPKKYSLKFEAENLHISIRIYRNNDEFTSLNQLDPIKMKGRNDVTKIDIQHAVKLLFEILENEEEFFFKVKKNKLIRCK